MNRFILNVICTIIKGVFLVAITIYGLIELFKIL